MLLRLYTLLLIFHYCVASNLCPINCKCLKNHGQCIIKFQSSVCLLKWGRLFVEINNWNLTDDITFSMCRSLHFVTLIGKLEYIDGDKLKFPSPNITDFHIENSGLQIIHDYSLQNMQFAKNVIITSNRNLTKLSRYFLYGLKQMYCLDLSSNSLMDISESFQVVLSGLRILKLNDNKIYSIKMDTFKHLRQLKVLEIANNNLAVVEDFGFRGLLNVVNLQLNNNLLIDLNHLELLEMSSLQTINLQHNKIEVFNLPSCNKQLKVIFLMHNNMSFPPIISQNRCTGLKRIFVKHNFIAECVGGNLFDLYDLQLCEYPVDATACQRKSNSSLTLCIVLIIISLCILTLSVFVPILFCKHQRSGLHKYKFNKSIINTKFPNEHSKTQYPIT